jgi:hypothetical protein
LICVLHPVGPLPASVYWRRRVFALAVALVLLLIVWLVAGGGTGGSGPGHAAGPTGGTPTGSGAPSGSADPGASGSMPSETLAATSPAHDPGRSGGGSATGTDPTTPTPGGGTGSGGGTGEGGSSGTGGTPAGTQAAAPVACPDGALRLTITAAKPDYPVGAQPQITLSVQNVSGAACTRDLGASQQEVLLYAGKTRLWSSNDCYPGGGQDIETIAPGERDRYSVTWSGLSSHPRCAGTRTRVAAGHYSLVGRIGTLRGEPATLVLH